MSIALLYERSETDEIGIKFTAKKLGIDLAFIPFRKIALSINNNDFSAKTKGKDFTKSIELFFVFIGVNMWFIPNLFIPLHG